MTDVSPGPLPADMISSALKGVGIRPLAKEMGFKGHMRVWNWARDGRIPPRHWRRVNDGIAALGGAPLPEDVLRRAHETESP